MLSGALQPNVKHEARPSNISVRFNAQSAQNYSEILRFAQNDISGMDNSSFRVIRMIRG
jgi:hypothetical protein